MRRSAHPVRWLAAAALLVASRAQAHEGWGIVVGGGGATYVADYAGRRLLELTPQGEVRTVLRTGRIWSPTGVAVAPDGLYLLEHLRMPLVVLGDLGVGPYLRVRKVAADGRVTELVRLRGRNSGAAGLLAVAYGGLLLGAALLRRRRRASARARTAGAETTAAR